MIKTSFDGASATFSTVRGLSLVCSFLICLILFEIGVGQLAEVGLYCRDLIGWSGTWPLGSTDCEPNAISPWFGVWGCWVGPKGEIVACACGLWEGAAICFSCSVFQWLRVSSGDCYLVLTFSSYCLIIATISPSFCAYTFSDANTAILATK